MNAAKLALVVAPILAAIGLASSALGGSGAATMAQSQAAGWDCAPQVLILGYYHCAPPGKPSVLDMVLGDRSSPSIVLRVFHPDGTYAGTEMLRRNDLYRANTPCRQDNLATWDPLPFGYYACHHFDT